MGHINRLDGQSQDFLWNAGRCGLNLIFHNAYVFADFHDPVGAYIFQTLHEAAGPANLDGIGLGGFARAKMAC
jgi:hypothetical protein